MIKTKLFKRLGLIVLTLCAACSVCAFGACEKDDGAETDGGFYSLQEAYDNGYLSVDDLKNIAYYQNGVNNYEDFTPIDIGELDEETSLAIRTDYLNNGGNAEYTLDDVSIEKYYGTYSGCVVVSVSTSGNSALDEQSAFTSSATNTWWTDTTIGDVTLLHVVHDSIKVWKDMN